MKGPDNAGKKGSTKRSWLSYGTSSPGQREWVKRFEVKNGALEARVDEVYP